MIFPLPSVPQGGVAAGYPIVIASNFLEYILSNVPSPLKYSLSSLNLKLTIYKDTFLCDME